MRAWIDQKGTRPMHPLRITREKVSRRVVEAELKKMVNLLSHEAHPLAIYVFGSAARGEFTDQSDIDIMVIMASNEEIKKAREKLKKHYPLSKYPVDLVWMLDEQFSKKKNIGGLCMIVNEEGRKIYSRETSKV